MCIERRAQVFAGLFPCDPAPQRRGERTVSTASLAQASASAKISQAPRSRCNLAERRPQRRPYTMDKKAQQYKIPGVLDLKKEPTTVYTEYIDAIKRGGTKYIGNAFNAPVESVGPATEFCRPCF